MHRTSHTWRPLAALGFALALVLPVAAAARPPGGPGGHLEPQIERLDLDEETQSQVDLILDDLRIEGRSLRRELHAAREEMRELLQSPDSDEATLVAQAERISALELEGHKQRIATHLALRAVLSAEQMETLVASRGEHPRRGGRGFRD